MKRYLKYWIFLLYIHIGNIVFYNLGVVGSNTSRSKNFFFHFFSTSLYHFYAQPQKVARYYVKPSEILSVHQSICHKTTKVMALWTLQLVISVMYLCQFYLGKD